MSVKKKIFMCEFEEKMSLQEFSDSGVLPQRISETGAKNEPLLEAIICDRISGGADYANEMPRQLSLIRRLADGTEYRGIYVLDFPRITT